MAMIQKWAFQLSNGSFVSASFTFQDWKNGCKGSRSWRDYGMNSKAVFIRVSLRWMELDETGDLNTSAAISANTKVKTGEALHDLLKIDKQMKSRPVNGKMFILRQRRLLENL